MVQLRPGYPEIKRRGAEIFQITATPPSQGSLYARHFPLTFPYLCDGDYAVHRRYGLKAKGGGLTVLKLAAESFPGTIAGIVKGEQPSLLPYLSKGLVEGTTMEQAIFLVGRDGRVRFRHIAGPHALIPSNETLLRALDSLP